MSAGFDLDLEPEVLVRLRAGQRQALAHVYDRFAKPVYGLALRVLANPEDAADLVQDIFIALPKSSRQFRGDARFGHWLRRVTSNATIDRLRARKRLTPLQDALDQLQTEAAPEDTGDAERLLAALSPTARLVLQMHAVEGYTHEEMAELFGQSPSYSKSILSRALDRLRRQLRQGDPEPKHAKATLMKTRQSRS